MKTKTKMMTLKVTPQEAATILRALRPEIGRMDDKWFEAEKMRYDASMKGDGVAAEMHYEHAKAFFALAEETTNMAIRIEDAIQSR